MNKRAICSRRPEPQLGYAKPVFAAGGSSLNRCSSSIRARLHVHRSPFSPSRSLIPRWLSVSPDVDREGAGLEGLALQQTAQSLAEHRADLLNAAADTGQVLARVRSRVSDYLAQTEQQIAFGQVSADVWERNRTFVDIALAEVAPDALQQFQAAYRRQAEDEPEARSQALLSCRRDLKSVADALYPARDEPVIGTDGKAHPMTDDKFVNRLVQFVSEALPNAAGEVLEAELSDFGRRLDALNELSSEGVHAKVTQTEVDVCIIRTYLFVGDLMRIREGVSAALQPIEAVGS